MVSGDSVDQMVNGVDDLSKIWQNSPEQAIRSASLNDLETATEIALRQEFVVVSYTSELGQQT